MAKKKKILIIGMGELGKHLAKKLDNLGNEICIVDIDKDVIEILEDTYDNAYQGDCVQIETLKKIGPKLFDACVVAIGDNFQASLEITANLKELGAKKIIAKSSSEIQSKFLKIAGADETIYPEKDVAEKLAILCDADNILNFIQLQDGYAIYTIIPPASFRGKTLKDLDLRNKYNLNIIAVIEDYTVADQKIIIPNAFYCLDDNDAIYVIAKEEDIKKLPKK